MVFLFGLWFLEKVNGYCTSVTHGVRLTKPPTTRVLGIIYLGEFPRPPCTAPIIIMMIVIIVIIVIISIVIIVFVISIVVTVVIVHVHLF